MSGGLHTSLRRLRSKILKGVADLIPLAGDDDDVRQAAEEFAGYLVRSSHRVRRRQAECPSDLHDPGHLLTLWLRDPDATDKYGKPVALPAKGAPPSVEFYLRRVNPRLQVETVLPTLLRNGTLTSVGELYIPARKFVLHKETLIEHETLSLFHILENFAHQQNLAPGETSWPQRVVECPDIPANRLERYIKKLTERIGSFTESENNTMLQETLNAPRSARRVRIALNVVFSVLNEGACEESRQT